MRARFHFCPVDFVCERHARGGSPLPEKSMDGKVQTPRAAAILKRWLGNYTVVHFDQKSEAVNHPYMTIYSIFDRKSPLSDNI